MAETKEAVKPAPKAQKSSGGRPKSEAPKGPAFAVSDGRQAKHAVPRLKKSYAENIVPQLMERHAVSNPMAAPRIQKIVINIGVSEAKDNIQMLDSAREDLALITGQWPQLRRAKKSISNFKLREGSPIGLRVTLRGDRMYEFLDRLISTAIPRIRDFRGLEPRGFDGTGNFNLGLKEQLIFPEVNVERSLKQRGMNISFVMSSQSDALSLELLRGFGMPFKKSSPPSGESQAAAGAGKV